MSRHILKYHITVYQDQYTLYGCAEACLSALLALEIIPGERNQNENVRTSCLDYQLLVGYDCVCYLLLSPGYSLSMG